MKTREQAFADAGRVVAEIFAATEHLTDVEAAERIYRPGGPSLEVLTSRITAAREDLAARLEAAREPVAPMLPGILPDVAEEDPA